MPSLSIERMLPADLPEGLKEDAGHAAPFADSDKDVQVGDFALAVGSPLGLKEKWLLAIMLGVMTGWVTSPWHGMPNTVVALAGLSGIDWNNR